jgi:hypothetical protein
MTALIIRFPEFHVRVVPANEGGWMVLCRSHGWLHGDRNTAVEDARWIAAGYGTRVLIREVAP